MGRVDVFKPLLRWQAWIGGLLICGACLRWRQSLIHGAVRLIGFCPGDNCTRSREMKARERERRG
jgi:hypothetical protein